MGICPECSADLVCPPLTSPVSTVLGSELLAFSVRLGLRVLSAQLRHPHSGYLVCLGCPEGLALSYLTY